MTLNAPTFNPTTTATQLATAAISDRRQQLNLQSAAASATATGLNTLRGAIGTFRSTLDTLGVPGAVLANRVSLNQPDAASATAGPAASNGIYNFYVEQLATVGQVAYNGVPDSAASGAGTLTVHLADGNSYIITLSAADKDGNGVLAVKEIAAAINVAASQRLAAAAVTVNGGHTLMLTSLETGADQAITLDTSGVTDPALKAALDDASVQQAAQDAVIWLGAQTTGTRIQQAGNSFTGIDDVTLTFTRAQQSITATVARDPAASQANMQRFVDNWNKLNDTLRQLSAVGSAQQGTSAGPFANDAGVAALKQRLYSVLHQQSGGLSLANLGVRVQRDGSIALDGKIFERAMAEHDDAFGTVFGSASLVAPSGVLGTLDRVLRSWSNSSDGQITMRYQSNNRLQASLAARQARLDAQYDSAYKRYLAQFTALQGVQAQMNASAAQLAAIFGGQGAST